MAKFEDIKGRLLDIIAEGATIDNASKAAGCARSQVYAWMRKYPDFAAEVKEAQKTARAKIVPDLERALFKRALGYEYEERKVETFPDGNDRVTVTRKQIPPDVASLVFALCNLAPGDWRNKIEQKVEGDLRTTVKVEVEDKDTQKEIDKLGR